MKNYNKTPKSQKDRYRTAYENKFMCLDNVTINNYGHCYRNITFSFKNHIYRINGEKEWLDYRNINKLTQIINFLKNNENDDKEFVKNKINDIVYKKEIELLKKIEKPFRYLIENNIIYIKMENNNKYKYNLITKQVGILYYTNLQKEYYAKNFEEFVNKYIK